MKRRAILEYISGKQQLHYKYVFGKALCEEGPSRDWLFSLSRMRLQIKKLIVELCLYGYQKKKKKEEEIAAHTMSGNFFIFKKLLEGKFSKTTFSQKCKFNRNSHNEKAVPALVGSRVGKCFNG